MFHLSTPETVSLSPLWPPRDPPQDHSTEKKDKYSFCPTAAFVHMHKHLVVSKQWEELTAHSRPRTAEAAAWQVDS